MESASYWSYNWFVAMVVWHSDSKCIGNFCERYFTTRRVEIYETAQNTSQGLQVIVLLCIIL